MKGSAALAFIFCKVVFRSMEFCSRFVMEAPRYDGACSSHNKSEANKRDASTRFPRQAAPASKPV